MKQTPPVELPYSSEAFSNAWNEWIEYRKERRLPKYTERGLKKTFTMLTRISENNEAKAIEIIDYSIAQNYQGLYAPKNVSNGASNNQSRTTQQLSQREWLAEERRKSLEQLGLDGKSSFESEE